MIVVHIVRRPRRSMPPKTKLKVTPPADGLAPLFPDAVLAAPAGEPKGELAASSSETAVHLVPHEGLVILANNACGQLCVYHTLTLEVKPLPPGQWEVVFDEEGYGALIRQDDGEGDGDSIVLMCEDFFSRRLYRTAEAKVLMLQFDGGSLDNFEWLRTRYTQVNVTVDIGRSAATLPLRSYLLHWPRFGRSRLFFDIDGLFKALKIGSGTRLSKWRYQRACRWSAQIRQNFGDEQFIDSTRKKGVELTSAFLPHASVSTTGLLLLLNRVANTTRKGGGLASARDQLACAELLHSILNGAVKASRGIRIEIFFEEPWRCEWPLPPRRSANSVIMGVKEDGCFNSSAWGKNVTGKRSSGLRWYQTVQHFANDNVP